MTDCLGTDGEGRLFALLNNTGPENLEHLRERLLACGVEVRSVLDKPAGILNELAAAKMEIYRLQQTRWLECRRDYEQEPGDPERYHTACAALMEMLDSGVLSPRERSAYRKR